MKNKLVMKTVDILRKAKAIYKSGYYIGMCTCIGHALDEEIDLCDFDIWVKTNVPLFSPIIAKEKFGATKDIGYWWYEWDEDSRLEYFDWLIEQYSKKD